MLRYPRYLDARSDVVFGKIFGQHSELLKSFLNAVLPLPQDCSIESLTYLPIGESDHKTERFIFSVANVCCLDNHDCSFIVKIELQWSTDVVEWNYFNKTEPRARKIEKEEVCRLLSPAYRLAIIDDTFKQDSELFHYYRMTNTHNEGKSSEDIQLVTIELPKVSLTSIAKNRLAVLWIRFLKEINEKTETVDSSLLEVKEIKEALSLLEISSYSSAEYNTYERSWDAVSTLRTLLSGTRKEVKAERLAEFKAQGIQEAGQTLNVLKLSEEERAAYGRFIESERNARSVIASRVDDAFEEGEAKGLAKGKAEMITNMHNSGAPMEQMRQFSGLTQEEVEKIIGFSR